MLSQESPKQAIAKRHRLVVGLICLLAASPAVASVSAGIDCNDCGALACECCQSLPTDSPPVLQTESCCESSSADPPSIAPAELCTPQRDTVPDIDESILRESISSAQPSVSDARDRSQPRTVRPLTYLLSCALLI